MSRCYMAVYMSTAFTTDSVRTHDGHMVCVVLGCIALLTGTEGLQRLQDVQHQQSHRYDLLEPVSDA